VVRLALEQGDDTVELPVREAELAMERLFDRRAQTASLPGAFGGSGADGCLTRAPPAAFTLT
jgi:hypothetical protein